MNNGQLTQANINVKNFKPGNALVEVDATKTVTLILQQTSYPGWNAKVDGANAKVESANNFLTSVQLNAGSHQVEFFYQPYYLWMAWVTIVMTLLLLIATVILAMRKLFHQHQLRSAT